MAKRTSRGRKSSRGGRSRRVSRSSASSRRSGRGGRSGRKQSSMYGSHEGVSAPARDEIRQGERDFETA